MTTPRPGVNRMRRVAGAGLGIMLAVALVSPVAAAPERVPFSGVFYPCGGTNGEEFVTGNVLHFRDASNSNLWVTGNPLVDGVETNVARININLKTGRGVANIRSTIMTVNMAMPRGSLRRTRAPRRGYFD